MFMFQQKCLFILCAALVAGWLTCGSIFAGEYNRVVNIGDPMPSFANLPATDGSTLSSDQIKEDVVVFAFLANHCPWVKGGDGDLVRFVNDFKGKSVKVIGVSVNHREDDRLPAMKEHAAKVGYNFTYIFDESQDLGRKLGAARTPEFYAFDSNRRLIYMGLLHNSPARMTQDGSVKHSNGTPTDFHLKDAVLATLAGKPVAIPETRSQGCNVEYAK
jgi:peroxiredoxin